MTPSEKAKTRARKWAQDNPDRRKAICRKSWRRNYYKTPRPGANPHKSAPTVCETCGGAVRVPPSARKRHSGGGKYCSLKCYHAAVKRQPNRVCRTCAKPFSASSSQLKHGQGVYCSMACRPKAGPNAPLEYRRRSRHRRRARTLNTSSGPVNYERIQRRDKMRCHICRRKVKPADLEFDHVIPLAKGGTDTETNIAVSHKSCNRKKHVRIITLF